VDEILGSEDRLLAETTSVEEDTTTGLEIAKEE